jgi:hypothetical protein
VLVTRFRKVVEGLDHHGLDTQFQYLRVIAEDGRVLDGSVPGPMVDTMVEAFARAAAQLRERGELSPVIETDIPREQGVLHAYHVIVLLERTPELRVPRAERLKRLTPELQRIRAHNAKAALLQQLRGAAQITVARNAESLLADLRGTSAAAEGDK